MWHGSYKIDIVFLFKNSSFNSQLFRILFFCFFPQLTDVSHSNAARWLITPWGCEKMFVLFGLRYFGAPCTGWWTFFAHNVHSGIVISNRKMQLGGRQGSLGSQNKWLKYGLSSVVGRQSSVVVTSSGKKPSKLQPATSDPRPLPNQEEKIFLKISLFFRPSVCLHETCLQHKHRVHHHPATAPCPLCRVILITPKRAASYVKKAKKERRASAKKGKKSPMQHFSLRFV